MITDKRACDDWGSQVEALAADAANGPNNHWMALHHLVKTRVATTEDRGGEPKSKHFKEKNKGAFKFDARNLGPKRVRHRCRIRPAFARHDFWDTSMCGREIS